jgi:hypothetical protein
VQRPRITLILLLSVFLPLTAACGLMTKGESKAADPAPGKIKLSGDQLDELVRGNTLVMEEYGVKAKVELHPDGSLRAFRQDISDQTRGTWDIEGDTLCMKFKRWGGGDEQCYAVYKAGEEYQQYTSTGLMASRFTVTPGVAHNPVAVKARRPHQTEEPAKKSTGRATVTDQPNVVAPPPSAPAIQESSSRSYNPDVARRDLNAIYRDMTQDCPGCNLANINLANASMTRANLAGANLSGTNLSGTNLKWANLKGANLSGANLTKANLAGADLAGANLERADLTGASLTKTNLRGANIGSAIGANLKDAIR